ncbi:MAG: hypothetical protein WAV28_18665 [Sedimentisphaerales bacterium]
MYGKTGFDIKTEGFDQRLLFSEALTLYLYRYRLAQRPQKN